MPTAYGAVCNLWDFAADSGALLERLAGEVGLDEVVVPVVTGPAVEFRLVSPDLPPRFETEGGWHFPPNLRIYQSTGLRPPRARWFGTADHLARLCELAGRAGLQVILRIDVLSPTELHEREARLGVRNAWGQPAFPGQGCPLNTDTRALLRATFDDLRRYQPAAFELADWIVHPPLAPTICHALSWCPPAGALLELCFCPACRQVAEDGNIDAERAARAVRARAVQCAEQTETRDDDANTLIQAYRNACRAAHDASLQRLAGGSDRIRRVVPASSAEGCPVRGTHVETIVRLDDTPCDPVAGALLAPWPPGDARPASFELTCGRPQFTAAATFVRCVAELGAAGVARLTFAGVARHPPTSVTWLKQAVRFARRGG